MTDEQTTRIIIGGIIIAALPYIKILICRHLGDDYESQRNWRYALGKTVGGFIGRIRRYL